jgi:hypothetical protein
MNKQNKVIIFLLLGIVTILSTTTTAIFVKGTRSAKANNISVVDSTQK